MRISDCLLMKATPTQSRTIRKLTPKSTGGTAFHRHESEPARHTKFDLCSKRSPAPKPKTRANPFGAFAHSLQTPVPVLPRPKDSRIDATTIVAHGDAQLRGAVFDLGL